MSLFSGALGLDIGLHAAGFSTNVALDIDKTAKKVSIDNFPALRYLLKDIRKADGAELLEASGLGASGVDLLAGGPPCQPFSKSGMRKGLKDERGNLFAHYIRLLEETKPRAFLLENVRGILSSNRGEDFKNILDHLEDTGYTVFSKVLDSANYGVPQFRQRLFLIGFRERLDFSFPSETHSAEPIKTLTDFQMHPLVSLQKALKGLGDPGEMTKYNGKYAHLLKEIPEGLNYSYFCKERGHPKPIFKWRSKFWYFLLKADRTKPSLTIQALPGNNTGPFHWENRRFGINELKRIQTFPDWFEFSVPYFAAHKLIGNAVPPLLAYKIGESIAKTLKEKRPLPKNKERIFHCNNLTRVESYRGSGKGKLVVMNGKVVVKKR
jgi:DNA (cytosine-5)-methyltransferase 1